LESQYPEKQGTVVPEELEAFINKMYIETLTAAATFLTRRSDKCDSASLIKTYVPNDRCLVRASVGNVGLTANDLDTNLRPSGGIVEATLNGRSLIVKEDLENDDYICKLGNSVINYAKGEQPKSVMCVPAIFDSLKLGVILLQSRKLNFFSTVEKSEYHLLGDLVANVFKHDPYWKTQLS